MNPELQAVKNAIEAGEWDTVRDLSTAYVRNHPEMFISHAQIVQEAENETAARDKIVEMIGKLRSGGPLTEQHVLLGEIWQLHRWDPLHVNGVSQPNVRNSDLPTAEPTVRNHD